LSDFEGLKSVFSLNMKSAKNKVPKNDLEVEAEAGTAVIEASLAQTASELNTKV
jgi:hypothetical protein